MIRKVYLTVWPGLAVAASIGITGSRRRWGTGGGRCRRRKRRGTEERAGGGGGPATCGGVALAHTTRVVRGALGWYLYLIFEKGTISERALTVYTIQLNLSLPV
jgi:hypothetical protein